MLIDFIKKNVLLHFLTNSFLLGNSRRIARGNRVTGKRLGLMTSSALRVKGTGNKIEFLGAGRMTASRICITGNDNCVTVMPGFYIDEAQIWIAGSRNRVVIGDTCQLVRCEVGCEYDGNEVTVGDRVKLGGFLALGNKKTITENIRVYAAEGTRISFGKNSIISDGAVFRTSDSHPILQRGGARLNPAADINVGEDVWVCSGAAMLKGSALGNGCILGFRSVLTGDMSRTAHALLVGSPARVIRENVEWKMKIDKGEIGS